MISCVRRGRSRGYDTFLYGFNIYILSITVYFLFVRCTRDSSNRLLGAESIRLCHVGTRKVSILAENSLVKGSALSKLLQGQKINMSSRITTTLLKAKRTKKSNTCQQRRMRRRKRVIFWFRKCLFSTTILHQPKKEDRLPRIISKFLSQIKSRLKPG